MPAPNELATAYSAKECKDSAIRLLFGDIRHAFACYSVFTFLYALYVSCFHQLIQPTRNVLTADIEIIRHYRRRLYCEYIRVCQPLKESIICLSHPFGPVPNTHRYDPFDGSVLSGFARCYYVVTTHYSLVTKYKPTAERSVSNDTPAARSLKSPGGVQAPDPVVVTPRPCRKTTPGGLKVAKRPAESTHETSWPDGSTTPPSAKPWREADEL